MSTFRPFALILALLGGCDAVDLAPDACEVQPVAGTTEDRTDLQAELDAALSGGALEVPATWSDATGTTLTISADIDLDATSRLERPCSGDVTGWSAPADLTVRTADGRLDGQVQAEVTAGPFKPVTFVVDGEILSSTTLTELGVPGDAEIGRTAFRLFEGTEPTGELLLHWIQSSGTTEADSGTSLLSW